MTEREASGRKIDWDEVRRRIDSFGEALSKNLQPSHERKSEILRKRAQLFASVEKPVAQADFIEAVEFMLAYEKYAVESAFVREIFPMTELTPVPCTPSFVLGIINVRGQIISVIDIKKFFDLPEKGLTDLNKVIILKSEDMEFGILADSITGCRYINPDSLKILPTLTGIREEYLKGVTDENITVLDAGKLLSGKSIIVYENIE
ncbi:MAG: purine-binding chemotaxis protein CheW [Deltaproteobacteria bacterium]|nr:purine-binding chemotaxis protein CheW [Deltaproteobacteria bacterium]